MQVLHNFIANAIKFTPRGGRVTIRCDGEDDHASITVADTGVGFSPRQKDELFRAFSQLRPADASRGTGLGLYVSTNDRGSPRRPHLG